MKRGPPPGSLHSRVERSRGPRFVSALFPKYAESLALIIARGALRMILGS